MAPLVECHKCKKHVDIKTTALCSVCNHRYEPDCIGYPGQTYRMMHQESKKKWKCVTCIKNKNSISSDLTNITLRNKKKPVNTQPLNQAIIIEKHQPVDASQIHDSHVLTDCNSSSESDYTPPKMSKSLDGTSSDLNSDLISLSEMKDTISQLTGELNCTQSELDKTLLENHDLQKQVNKLTAENNMLKSLCQSTSLPDASFRSSIKKKRHSLAYCTTSTPSSPIYSSNANYENKTISLKKQIEDLQLRLDRANLEISALTKQIETLSQYLQNKTEVLNPTTFPRNHEHRLEKTIFIFGTQQCVGLALALLQSRSNTKYEKYGILAETNPNAKCDIIIQNCIKTTLKPNDKLVICIGKMIITWGKFYHS
ncbi:hypothetical protein HW555_010157 [Spodoptera exigua]|uniref:PHD-type domain-containing protein n=1 Tax=Spodoptera exigua TaxID=7107 RepID=A0A835L1U1_SPOEX|nr:hypothetical protein HW555_010157 [Spodoptera exigua]